MHMTKFSDLKLDKKVLKAVEEAGYETPTPIQAGAIPPALEGSDVLGIAQTGTGKTASFTLPMITALARGRARARMPRSLVLCPTRELAAQVAANFDTYSKHVKLTKALLIGGVSFKEQDALIDKGVDVLIATPGRLLDHFERGKLLLTGVQIMVVDEADRMLDMGFIPDIERIFSLTPFTRQTLFFSATMAPEIERLTNTFLSAPAKIEVARAATTGENISQGVVMFRASRKDREASEKRRLLRELIAREGAGCKNAIIFCNRKTEVDTVAKSMKSHGLDAAPIHGDLDQSKRMETLAGFRDGSLRFLVASDVAARGLDIPAVSHVFNYDVPGHAEDYVHRIGRTGRAGLSGTALMICVPRDEKNLEAIERLVEMEIPRIPAPGASADAGNAADAATAPVTAEPGAAGGEDDEADARSGRSSRSRSRSRSRPRRSEEPGTRAATEAAPPTEAKGPAAADADEQAGGSAGDAPRKTAEAGGQRENAQGRSRSRGGRSSQSGGGKRDAPTPVGLGDHLPSFIALSFDERRTG